MDQGMYGKQHARLAEELRRLRRASGMSAAAFGPRVGLSQSSVSRYETGRLTPTAALVTTWAEATGAAPQLRAELVEIAQELATEFNSWRVVHRESFAGHQSEIMELESRTQLIRIYQPATIPGLLQIPEYMRQMLLRLPSGPDVASLPAAIASRMERQAALYDTTKRFEFVITEAALRSRICPDAVLRAQWDRLLVLITLGNVDIRIIPVDVELPVVTSTSFVMFDDELVIIETLTNESVVRDERDIATYAQTFQSLMNVAWQGADARNILTQLIQGADNAPNNIDVLGTSLPSKRRTPA